MARPLVINSAIQIPGRELSLTFARSAGPGGQNVNKVNSKAILRWQVVASPSLPADVKARFLQRFPQRINQQGEVILASDRHREQPRNIAECYHKLRQMLQAVLEAERPRKKTRPSRAAVERRLQSKRRVGQQKQQRRYRPGQDD